MIIAYSPAYQANDATVTASSNGPNGNPGGIPPNTATSGFSDATMEYDNTYSIIPNGYDIEFATAASGYPATLYMSWNNTGWFFPNQTVNKFWFRVSGYFTANPSATQQIAGAYISGSKSIDIAITSTGKVIVRNNSNTTMCTTTNSIPLNTRFRIEGWCLADPSVGQAEIKLFSTEAATSPEETQTSTATYNTLTGPYQQMRWGLVSATYASISAFWLGNFAVSDTGYVGPGAIVQQMVVGAPTDSGFTAISKVIGGTACRLQIATDSGFTENVQYVGPQSPDDYGYVKHVAVGLVASTQYYCRIMDSPASGTEAAAVGQTGAIKTLPAAGSQASFTVSLVSCIDSGGNTDSPTAAIDDWVSWNADLKIFTGDFDYDDPTYTNLAQQIGIFEEQIIEQGDGNGTSMQNLVSQGWGYYCVSDHDTGPDNGDSDTDYLPYNIAARQEVFPFGTLGDTEDPPHGLYQTWVAGRVRFIMVDIRNIDRTTEADTDNGAKTMLGSTQLQWFYEQLVQPEPLKVVIGDTAWMGDFLETDLDKWWSYSTERQAIIDFLAANSAKVKNIMWWHGDTHCLGVCPATDNSWGNFPVYCAAPMKQTGAAVPNASETFTSYYNNSGGDCRQYGRITITDSGSTIQVQFSGWDALNGIEQISQTDTFDIPDDFTGVSVNVWNGSEWVQS